MLDKTNRAYSFIPSIIPLVFFSFTYYHRLYSPHKKFFGKLPIVHVYGCILYFKAMHKFLSFIVSRYSIASDIIDKTKITNRGIYKTNSKNKIVCH